MADFILPQRRPFAHPSAKIVTAVPDNLVLALRLGRSGTDAESRKRVGYNLAPNGPRGPASRVLLGEPTIFDDYWRFANDLANPQALRYPIDNPNVWCGYVVARTTDAAPVGSTGCPIFGWYSGNDGFGDGLVQYSTAALRLLGYEGTPVALKNAALSHPNNAQSTWRALYLHVTGAEIKMQNLTGDSVANAPAPTAFALPHYPGVRKLTVGSFYQTYAGSTTDVHALRVYSGVTHDDATKATILAELRAAAGTLVF